MSSNISHEIIVVGAGHNGLTAAAYLAKVGRKVTVLEASPVIGGMLGSNSIIPGAPDHIHNEGGYPGVAVQGVIDHQGSQSGPVRIGAATGSRPPSTRRRVTGFLVIATILSRAVGYELSRRS